RIGLSGGTGEIHVLDAKGRVLESFGVPNGAQLLAPSGTQVAAGTVLAKWDPHITPIINEKGGKIRLMELVENQTLRKDRDETTGAERWVILEHKGDLHPRIELEDDQGKIIATYYMPERAFIEVREGAKVSPGTLLAKLPREVAGTQDITGGLPRVTEIFEARTPRDPAKMAEREGLVRLEQARKRGKRVIYVRPVDDDGKPTGEEIEHVV